MHTTGHICKCFVNWVHALALYICPVHHKREGLLSLFASQYFTLIVSVEIRELLHALQNCIHGEYVMGRPFFTLATQSHFAYELLPIQLQMNYYSQLL